MYRVKFLSSRIMHMRKTIPHSPSLSPHGRLIPCLKDSNPPMRLACGHAISKDAMKKLVGHSRRWVSIYVHQLCTCLLLARLMGLWMKLKVYEHLYITIYKRSYQNSNPCHTCLVNKLAIQMYVHVNLSTCMCNNNFALGYGLPGLPTCTLHIHTSAIYT